MEIVNRRRVGIVASLALSITVMGFGPAAAATGRIVLSVPSGGTQSGFDVDGATLTPATASSTDVRTNTSTTFGYRQLVALNNAGVAKIGMMPLGDVSCAMLRSAAYGPSVFTGVDGTTDPVPGTVYAVRSVLNVYAKMSLVAIDTGTPKGLILDYETSDCPLDSTPPVITPSVTGPAGNAGWYVGHVTVSWTVADPESDVSTSGCDDTTLTEDTVETTVTCSATSAGGSASDSVTVGIDQTDPTITYTGNRGTYELDEQVTIECTAADGTSGVASDDCASVDAPAHTFDPGEHSMSAQATDVAGHHGSGSTTFTVVVTPGGLIRLILQHVPDPSVASSLRKKVESIAGASNANAKAGATGAFRGFVSAKTGKGVSEQTAALLSHLAGFL